MIDDVLTTGNSVKACRNLLLKAGAKEVKVIVLGRTIRKVEETYDLISEKLNEYIEGINKDIDYEIERNNQKFKIKQLIIEEDIKTKHEEVDEWASEEHDNLDLEAEGEHESINEREQELNYALYLDQEAEESKIKYIPNISIGMEKACASEAHRVLKGEICFSYYNPFMALLNDW